MDMLRGTGLEGVWGAVGEERCAVSALWIRALGPLEVVVDGTPVAVGAAQQRIVLECLALRANAVVTSDFLVQALWADNPPTKPGPQLQVYVANLRRMLDPDRSKGVASQRLASRSGGYVLTVMEEELDLLQFREQVAAGELAVQAGDLVGGRILFAEPWSSSGGRYFLNWRTSNCFGLSSTSWRSPGWTSTRT